MDERQKDLSNYRITQADDSLKVADYCLKETNELFISPKMMREIW